MTPHRVRRAEAQAEIAAEADRIRCVLGVDQADLAEAIGTGPTHVQHLLARRDQHTVTLADVVLAAVQRLDAGLAVKQRRLRAVGR